MDYRALRDHVRPKTGLLRFAPPFLAQKTALAIYPTIYLPDKEYRSFMLGRLEARLQLVIVHELAHLERQKEMGLLLWLIKYCIDKKFRLNEELIAVKSSLKLSKSLGVEMNIDRISRNLSGPIYLWMVSYDEAYRILS